MLKEKMELRDSLYDMNDNNLANSMMRAGSQGFDEADDEPKLLLMDEDEDQERLDAELMHRDQTKAEIQEAISHKNQGLVIDIYNVRKFSMKCKKAYEFFQQENEGIL